MKIVRVMILGMAGLIAGCGGGGDANEPYELARIAALAADEDVSGVGSIRSDALRETATSIGAQGGLAWRAEQINCLLKSQSQNLDKIYNFRMLMLRNHISPPVLAEGRDELHKDDCETIRTADMIYRIIKPPCFETTTPDWREYIWLNFEKPEPPDASMLPKTREEASLWNCFVRQGWEQGAKQAEQIFVADLARLNRDYTGMVLYHRLFAQGMVTEPYVAETELGVTGDAYEMRVNDRILRITATSQLNTNADEWKAAVWNERGQTHIPYVLPKMDSLPQPELMLHSIKELPNHSRYDKGHYLVKR